MIRHHPDSDLLLEYAAGVLTPAPTVSVTAHLHFCKRCQAAVEAMGEVGGGMLEQQQPADVSDSLLDKVLLCIADDAPAETKPVPVRTFNDELINKLPAYVRGLLPGQDLPWRKLTAGLRVAQIDVGEDECELALHRIDAGGKTPNHDHLGREITVVLTGSFSDEDGVYQPGDYLVREPGEKHTPFAARNEACICLSVLEAPIKLTGMKRVLNPFLRFSPS